MTRALLAVLPSVLLCACGYVGDPLPPALNVPNRVTDLAVMQRGDKIVITYTIPPLTTENLPVRNLGPADLQVGTKSYEIKPGKPGRVTDEIPVTDWIGQEPAFRLRLNNGRGRFSDWSNQVTARIVEPLAPPANVVAASDPKGVKITWKGDGRPGESWRIYREGVDQPLGTAAEPQFVDQSAEYGKTYTYRVEALQAAAESLPAVSNAVTPKDEFAPAVPTGLTVIQGIDTIELNWDPNSESDLKAYRVYRSTGNGSPELVADSVEAPSFSDKKVKGGTAYHYAISAVDQTGNESAKSQAVEITMR